MISAISLREIYISPNSFLTGVSDLSYCKNNQSVAATNKERFHRNFPIVLKIHTVNRWYFANGRRHICDTGRKRYPSSVYSFLQSFVFSVMLVFNTKLTPGNPYAALLPRFAAIGQPRFGSAAASVTEVFQEIARCSNLIRQRGKNAPRNPPSNASNRGRRASNYDAITQAIVVNRRTKITNRFFATVPFAIAPRFFSLASKLRKRWKNPRRNDRRAKFCH